MKRLNAWIETANNEQTDFPLNNLPYGVAKTNPGGEPFCCTAIGDQIANLALLEREGLLDLGIPHLLQKASFNDLMTADSKVWEKLRNRLQDLLSATGDPSLKNNTHVCERVFSPLTNAQLLMPFKVSEYTDFYSGKQHAINAGSMFRDPENALPPNWLHMPIGYNGRASSVVVSGTPIHRPLGQMKPAEAQTPIFGPSRRLDFELEMGAIVGKASDFGTPITLTEADEMIFGFVLLNDWSSRDIQGWEAQPLGPFQGKALGTSISPWIVTKAALEPFRHATPAREKPLLPYLQDDGLKGLFDIELEVTLQPTTASTASRICATNFKNMYFSPAQQLTHHAISGCPMNVGDLLGSGTISGADKTQYGSMLELSWGGKNPFTLETGETRSFLEDGDILTLKGHAQGNDFRIGFGECSGEILPAIDKSLNE